MSKCNKYNECEHQHQHECENKWDHNHECGCHEDDNSHENCECNKFEQCQGYCVGSYCYGKNSENNNESNIYNVKMIVTNECSNKGKIKEAKKSKKGNCSCNR